MPRLNTMALPQANLHILPFQAAVFKPQTPDINILGRSLDRLEQRTLQANDKISAMDLAFSQVRDKLHQDPETMAWFNDYSNDYKDRVNALANEGRYGDAIVAATRYAADAINNPELQSRIRSNEQYEDWRKQVQSSKAGDTTKERFLAQTPYEFRPMYDEQGNVIGGYDWSRNKLPVQHYAVADIQMAAERMATAQTISGSSGSEYPVDINGNRVDNYAQAAGMSGSDNASTRRTKLYNKLRSTAENLLAAHPEFRESLEQDYDDVHYRIEKFNRELATAIASGDPYAARLAQSSRNAEYQLLAKPNGNLMTKQEYIEQQIFPQLKNMETNDITTSSKNGLQFYRPSSSSDTPTSPEAEAIVNGLDTNTGQAGVFQQEFNLTPNGHTTQTSQQMGSHFNK